MKASNRILLVTLAFILAACCVTFSLAALGIISNDYIAQQLQAITDSTLLQLLSVVLAAILFLLSIRVMFVGPGNNKNDSTQITVTDNGAISISLSTIDQLVEKSVKSVEGVREMRVKAFVQDSGLLIKIKISVLQDSVLPDICKSVQEKVKQDIETLCGLSVKSIPVYIDNSITVTK